MAPSIQGPGSLPCPIRFCTNCKDGSSNTGPAQSSISARRYNRRIWFLVPVERQCVPFARYDSNKGNTRSLQKLQRAIVYFFYCYHVRVTHIIISHKRCINFRILYTYFRSSYCRLLHTLSKIAYFRGNQYMWAGLANNIYRRLSSLLLSRPLSTHTVPPASLPGGPALDGPLAPPQTA